jgi:hypothetical protein
MEIIFATEDLISDGIISVEEGDEIIKEARAVIISEQSWKGYYLSLRSKQYQTSGSITFS